MAFAKTTLFTLIFLLGQAYFSTAQSRIQSSLRFDYIFNGINESNPTEYEHYVISNKVKSKPSYSLGVQYDFFVDKKRKVSLSLGTLFEFRNFTRFVHLKYRSGWSNRYREHFRSQYISIPIGITYHFKKLKINASLVNMINLKTKLKASQCGFREDESCEYWQRFSIVNEFTNTKDKTLFSFENIYADNWYHQQLSIGLQYPINETISLGLEYRDFIRKNDLHYDRLDWDVYIEESFEQQSNSLHLKLLLTL